MYEKTGHTKHAVYQTISELIDYIVLALSKTAFSNPCL